MRGALSGLSEWINAWHSDLPAREAYAQSFAEHPARLMVIRKFLREPVARSLNRFLMNEAAFRPEYGLYSRLDEQDVTEGEWLDASPEDRFYRYNVFDKVLPESQLSLDTMTFARFLKSLPENDFRLWFESVTAMTLGRLTHNVHCFESGDFLARHNDNARDRLCAFVLYLSAEWAGSDGGILHMVKGAEKFTVKPEFNCIVVFDVQSGFDHYVSPVATDRRRLTIGGWLYRRGAT
jgi:Rps23 Pro-64 3,4-dihydroxylase Tpa1-like proline 4-hydroxylase